MITGIRRHPNLVIGVAALVLWASVTALGRGAAEPSGATKALLMVAYIAGWPFWIAGVGLRPLLGDSALVTVLGVLFGLAVCVLGDMRLRQSRRERSRTGAS